MAVIFPVVSLVLLLLIGSKFFQHRREALLAALMAWALLVTGLTEVLSLVGGFNAAILSLAWLTITVGLALILWQAYGPGLLESGPRRWFKIQQFMDLPVILKLSTVGLTLALALIGFTAVVAAPNHSDSMEYHLSRVMHWIQQGQVIHYPSHNIFQLYQNPWSEFAIAHLQLLSHGDRFAGCVQWMSLIGSLFGVSLIAKELGAKRNGQILAAIFTATMPMAVLQGSSTNNDHVVALWMVSFVYFALVIMRQGIRPIPLMCMGAGLGLAILTKGTAYIYAFPFCLWLLFWGIRRLRWRMVNPLVGVVAIVLVINGGHYLRNWGLFGSPLGVPGDETGAAVGLTYLMSNVVRNLALHADIVRNLHLQSFITPTTGITAKLIEIFHGIIGLDLSDPLITSAKTPKFYVPSLSFNEDTAGNPLHLAIILFSSGLLLLNGRLQQRRRLFIYWITSTATFLLFCQLLTWSTPRCRLHLPIFILFAALVGTVIGNSLNRRLVNGLALGLVLLSFQWVVSNQVRPLIGENSIFSTPRTAQYFATQPVLKTIYTDAVQEINNQSCSTIGMVFENISYEYPYWQLLNIPRKGLKMHHVNVSNESAPLVTQVPFADFQPCLILKTASRDLEASLETDIQVAGQTYQEVWKKTEDNDRAQKSVQLFTLN